GQQVRRRMPVHLQGFRILVGDQPKVGIFLEWTRKINQIAVRSRDHSRISQPWTDQLGYVQSGAAFGNFLFASVRKLYMNALCHKGKPVVILNFSVYWTHSGGSNPDPRQPTLKETSWLGVGDFPDVRNFAPPLLCLGRQRLAKKRRARSMLWTIAVLLLILWLLGMVSSYTLGGFIHILLVLAIIVVLIRVIQGRSPVA